MNEKMKLLAQLLIIWSICGVGKLSLGQALFKYLKSMQTLMVPYFLLTGMMFDTHSVKGMG